MRTILIRRFGDPSVLEPADQPEPLPLAGELRVRVHAAGINYFEALVRQGTYRSLPALPLVPGVEAAGIVDALGPEADPALLGTRVAVPLFVSRGAGGYAQWVTAPAATVVPLPDALGFEDATALLVQGLTALHAVRRSPPSGKRVLVTAAAGGVGSLLLQLARRAGATQVIGLVGSAAKQATVRALGADLALDTASPQWPQALAEATDGQGIDVAYDFAGGAVTAPLLEALAPGGEMLFGALGRFEAPPAALEAMFAANASLRGFALLPLLQPGAMQADLRELFALAAAGRLQVLRGASFPLDQAAEAHRALESRASTGKLTLIP